MRLLLLRCLLISGLALPILSAQVRVDPRFQHERVYAVVPMTGQGTRENPRRPAHLPINAEGRIDPASGILGFTMQLSDDGKFAIVEFVARDRAAFASLFADKTPGVRFFEKGKVKKDDIEKELKKLKKDFNIDEMGVSLP